MPRVPASVPRALQIPLPLRDKRPGKYEDTRGCQSDRGIGGEKQECAQRGLQLAPPVYATKRDHGIDQHPDQDQEVDRLRRSRQKQITGVVRRRRCESERVEMECHHEMYRVAQPA